MKRVLLIDPGKVSESWYIEREMPSLALGCLGTYLQSIGHTVRLIDMATYKVNNARLKEAVLSYQPDVVGLTSATFNVPRAFQAVQVVKEAMPDTFVVMGGPHASALPHLTLQQCPELDAVVVGEGELALAALCTRPQRGVIAEKRVTDLDTLPPVDWRLFDLTRFKKFYSLRFNQECHKFCLSIVRGCPFACKFCFKVLDGSARSRSPEHVFAEIARNHRDLGARVFYVADSTLLLFKEKIHELCRLIIDSGIEISLIVQSRADTVDEESVRLLKLAGCETFFVGVESGNEEILRRCGKNISKDQVRSAVRTLAAAEIPRIRCSFIIGLEGDTRKTIRETLEFSRELRALGMNRASVHCLDVYPGTPYWQMVEHGEGTLILRKDLHDWSSYSRLYPMASCGDIAVEELKALRDEGKAAFPEEL